MSAEFLAMPYWGGPKGFYPQEGDLARAKRRQIERSIELLPWIAQIDAFQLWAYENPRHTRDERVRQWQALDERFGGAADWGGLERIRDRLWHRQLHLFTSPLYYIEYGIAQLGALQMWTIAQEKGEKTAIDGYRRALSLGGSKPLPELFAAGGLQFDFGDDMVGRVAHRIGRELASLPL